MSASTERNSTSQDLHRKLSRCRTVCRTVRHCDTSFSAHPSWLPPVQEISMSQETHGRPAQVNLIFGNAMRTTVKRPVRAGTLDVGVIVSPHRRCR